MRPSVLLVPLVLVPALAHAQPRPTARTAPTPAAARAPETGAFVVTLGTDTVGAERYTRTGNRIEGDVFLRAPSPRVAHYVVTLDAQGRPTRAETRTRRHDGTPVPNGPLGAVVTFRADSVFAEVQRADSTARFATAAPAGTMPAVAGSVVMAFGLWDHTLRGLRAAGRDSAAVLVWGPGAPAPQPLAVALRGDSARLDYFGDPMVMRVDRRGALLRVDGSRTATKVVATRVPAVDVAGMARVYAARPAMGPASPLDSVKAAVGAAQVAVIYSRPSVRGRTVWGGVLVPYGQIWRTGANAATTFRTSADLVVGGARVPAGTYTLFTMPGATASQLVISKQTGQWGTEYKPDQDLARVPLTATALPAPVEQFTIAVEPAAAGGANLVMRWGDRQLSAPVQAAAQGAPRGTP